LGDNTEPCFEGAAFFALYKDLKKIVEQIEKYELNPHDGGKQMNYKLSDGAKFNAIWNLLNVNFTEAGGWLVEYDICEIYEEYAVVKNYNEGIWERIYYTKNDETDSVELGERVRCFFMDVTEEEKKALDVLHSINNNTYEKIDENYSNALAEVETKTGELTAANDALATKVEEYTTLSETHETKISEFETKIGELNESIATLTTERDDAISQLNVANNTVTTLTEEVATLNSFKAEIEKKEKEAIVSKYEKLLDADVLATYSAKIGEYADAKSLDKDLAYELVSTRQSVFTAEGNPQPVYIPKDNGIGSGLEAILDKYKK
jgi:myosin heavy subunit